MKTPIFQTLLLVAAASLAIACEDHRNDYMEDYQTMAYFRNGGEQEISLYRTGEDGIYSLIVCKSGRNLEGTISLEVHPMDQDAITVYNSVNYTDYTAIPSYLFSFWEEDETTPLAGHPLEIKFAPNESARVIKVKMKTNEIRTLMDMFPERHYVMGFQLFSAKGKISDKINLLVLTPEIAVPYLTFSNVGVYSYTYDKNSKVENTYSNRVKFGIDANRWDFTCKLEVKDADWLEDYNAAHGTDFEILPSSYYTMPSSVHFEKGVTEVPFDVTVNREGMSALRNYVIPIAVKESSKQEFVPYVTADANDCVYMVQVLMTPDQLMLQPTQLKAFYNGQTSADGTFHSYELLVDGDEDTYWMSPGSARYGGIPGDETWGFWFDIDISSQPLDAFVLGYLPSAIAVRCPTRIVIGVSDDGINYEMVADIANDDMHSRVGWYDLPLVKLKNKTRFIRMGLLETFINGNIIPLNTPDVDMTCEVAEIRLYGAAN